MKILHVSHLYSPSIGGNQIHNKYLSEYLVQLGHEVHVFTSNVLVNSQFFSLDPSVELPPKEEVLNGVHIRRFAINYGLNDLLFKKIMKIRGGYRFLKFLLRRGLQFYEYGPFTPFILFEIYRLKPDLMMAINGYSSMTYMCYLAKKIFGIPFVITPTTHTHEQWAENPSFLNMVKHADLVIALTEFEKQFFIDRGIDSNKIKVIGVGVELNGQLIGDRKKGRKELGMEEEPAVLFLGRRTVYKGVGMLIEAMKLLWKKIPKAKLIISGSKNDVCDVEIDQVISSVDEIYKKNIIEIDPVGKLNKGDIFSAADIFVMPSRIDSFGIVYLEAWANKIPVIACTQTPQETFIEDRGDGRLVEWGNSQKLADVIEESFSSFNQLRLMGEKGFGKVKKRYSWDVIVNKIDREYQTILQKNL